MCTNWKSLEEQVRKRLDHHEGSVQDNSGEGSEEEGKKNCKKSLTLPIS
jgi:hypothetical protein